MVDRNKNSKGNSLAPADANTNVYNSMQENLFQSISSMVLNIIQTALTTPMQFAETNKLSVLPLSNISEQLTKHKVVTGKKNAVNKYKLPVPKISYNVSTELRLRPTWENSEMQLIL